jgi:serine protease Do
MSRVARAIVPGMIAFLFSGVAVAPAWGEAIGDLFERVRWSVVVIRTLERDVLDEPGEAPTQIKGLGSGVLISSDGQVLTAAHLVQPAAEITVEFADGTPVSAHVTAMARSADLALLRLERVPAGAVVARLGDSDRARIGNRVLVVGAPHGYTHTLTVGHVSGRRRAGEAWDQFPMAEMLQTDAAINAGNSGGPLFNMDGDVLGIVSFAVTKSGGSEGLGFAVTVNVARQLLFERRTAWLGIDGILLTGVLQRIFNLREPAVLVQRIIPGSPAAALGLRGGIAKATVGQRSLIVGGDILLKVQGIPVGSGGRVRDVLGQLAPGAALTVTILREGEVLERSTIWPRSE